MLENLTYGCDLHGISGDAALSTVHKYIEKFLCKLGIVLSYNVINLAMRASFIVEDPRYIDFQMQTKTFDIISFVDDQYYNYFSF